MLPVVIAGLVLAFAYGDGVATGLQLSLGLASPFIVLLPCLGLAVFLIAIHLGRVPIELVVGAAILSTLGTALLLFQVNYFDKVNLAGFAQLGLFLLLLLALVEMFAVAPAQLASAFRRLLVFGHYFVSGYLILTLGVWLTTGRDLSVVTLITNSQPLIGSAVDNFRPSGLAREPAWAGFTLVANYIGVYLLAPKERVRGFVALGLAVGALQSATAFAFIGVFVLVGLVQHHTSETNRAQFAFMALIGVVVLLGLFRGRVEAIYTGADPSGLMRSDSADVAWNVMAKSFPEGVGYGNFRDEAGYGPQFANYVDLDANSDYKSDVMILNIVAEMGVAGVALLGWLTALAARGGHLLIWMFFAALFFLAGGLLIPPVAIVAVVIGLRERDRRAALEADKQPIPKIGLGRPQPGTPRRQRASTGPVAVWSR